MTLTSSGSASPPLAHAHDERVDVLIQDIDERDGVDDHVVRAVHVELHAGSENECARPSWAFGVAILQPLEESVKCGSRA